MRRFATVTKESLNEKHRHRPCRRRLLQASGCTACHTIDKKLVGPALKDVAAKYRDNKGAEADLIKKVKEGGKGVWGDIPMSPNAHVKDEDIKTIVQWILTLK